MPTETVLLIGRETPDARDVYETHARRLRQRVSTGRVRVETYSRDPDGAFRERLAAVEGDRVYAVPMWAGESYGTTTLLPRALHAIGGTVQYCDVPGRSPKFTDALLDRARAEVAPGPDASLVLVGLGSDAGSDRQRTTEYHAGRLRECEYYDEVRACYLMCNPAVECLRYNVTNERVVVVPVFLARTDATDDRIPTAIELDRGGLSYAEPVGDHERVTDAIHTEIERQRALAASEDSPDSGITGVQRVATDGNGRSGRH